MNTRNGNDRTPFDDRRKGLGDSEPVTLGELPQRWCHRAEFHRGSRWPGPPWSQAMRVEVAAWYGRPLVIVGIDVARVPVELVERPRVGWFAAPPGIWFTAFADDCRMVTPVSFALRGSQWAREKDGLLSSPELPELMLAVVDDGIIFEIDRYPSHPDWWRELRAAIDGAHHVGDLRGFLETVEREGSLIAAAERIGRPVHFADDGEVAPY